MATYDYRLTPSEKQQWLSALRSGDFIQGRSGYLVDEQQRYCCLGVKARIDRLPVENSNHQLLPSYILPTTIQVAFARLNDGVGDGVGDRWKIDEVNNVFPNLNWGGKALNFDEIANVIEEHL